MDPRRPSLDLATELTCSICTELLYQPLTLLDCLHTFCGACLKEWFKFQKEKIDRAPGPASPGAVLFTCPSCRASVRDTKHNATVVTLLDMYIAAKPNKARNADDREEMNRKYRPGDQIIPHVTTCERTEEDQRAEEEDRRLLDEVREMSLREFDAGISPIPPRIRRESRAAEERLSSHRPRDGGRSHRSTNQLGLLSDSNRRRRSDSQQRQVGHQSSLRSLISSADLSERDIEREIEEFARQIQEEGLLDGLDLDNIDLTRDDELSCRITEAYRRRQRGRTTGQPTRRESTTSRNNAHAHVRTGDSRRSPRSSLLDAASPPRSREGSSSRPVTGNSSTEERERGPPTSREVRESQTQVRRRTSSGSRAVTLPVVSTESLICPAGRSQTDLTLLNERAASSNLRPNTVRSSSVPSGSAGLAGPAAITGSSFAGRLARPLNTNANESPRTSTDRPCASSTSRPNRAAELSIVHSAATSPAATSPIRSGHQRSMSQLYPEPSITCARCNKTHIEYEIHYKCSICAGGHWSMCQDCYLSGKGCQYWFGFGHGGWNKWRRRRHQRGDESLRPPHILTPSRYQPPPSTPGGADGRKTLTMDDPQLRLETGTFCAKCQVWTNDCYWRCDICNDGEWGYCNNCVNQGRTCTHPLLPLSHEISEPHSQSPGRPTAAQIVTDSQTRSISPFKPLSFATTCDICRATITPLDIRYHCYSCTSSLVEHAAPGDYDICCPCYTDLVSKGKISEENGHSGWRRCLRGHRMVVIGFAPGEVGHWRYIERDLVGGRKLRIETLGHEIQLEPPSQKWSWKKDGQKLERLVTQEMAATAPTSYDSISKTTLFPPDGGFGLRGFAKWAWFPKKGADDELMFPRGAEIREAEDVNGDWYFGVYMGAKGLFPSGYVRVNSNV